MEWSKPRMPTPGAARARVGAPTWIAAIVVAIDLTLGTFLIGLTFSENHALSGSGPGDRAGTINLAMQSILVIPVLIAVVLRGPKAACLRSVPMMLVVAATSAMTVAVCFRATLS